MIRTMAGLVWLWSSTLEKQLIEVRARSILQDLTCTLGQHLPDLIANQFGEVVFSDRFCPTLPKSQSLCGPVQIYELKDLCMKSVT